MSRLQLGYIVWDPALGYITGALLFVGVCVCLFLSYRRIKRRFSGLDAFLLMAPRVIVGVLLLMLFFDPLWAVTRKVEEELRFLFLKDTTASMEVADRDETPRSGRAEDATQTLRDGLPENAEVTERRFQHKIMDENTEKADQDRRPSRTDIAQVLVDAAETHRSQNWDGIVLFTDGGDERFRVEDPPPVPVDVYVTGTKAGKHDDLAIQRVDAPSEVQKGTEFDVGVELQPFGSPQFLRSLDLLNVRVQLRSGDASQWETTEQKKVDLTGGGRDVQFTLEGLEREGRHTMRIVLESVSGELTELNNERLVPLEVVDRSLKTLLFTARPGQNEMILRRALGGDPGISVTSLIRMHGDQYLVQRSEKEKEKQETDEKQPLEEGFPSSPDRLSRYDVVVIGSFQANVWEEKQMNALLGFVREVIFPSR